MFQQKLVEDHFHWWQELEELFHLFAPETHCSSILIFDTPYSCAVANNILNMDIYTVFNLFNFYGFITVYYIEASEQKWTKLHYC